MSRRVAIALAVAGASAIALLAACNGDSDEDAATATTATTTAPTAITATAAPAATTTAVAAAVTTTTAAITAMNAVLEPDTVAGLPLGSNKSAAIAVLGSPTNSGQETDLSGARYDYLRWEFGGSGIRGLVLNYRTPSVTSPLLTDWAATATGPRTALNVTVGDAAATVTTAYGPLQNFCCEARIANVERGGGRLIVIVSNADQRVRQIIGGDPGFWSRSIAD